MASAASSSSSWSSSSTFWRQVRGLFGPLGTAAGLGEAELLGRFVRTGDPVAFEALVTRHGPMVWGVCRRILGEASDADDAFQATFLVLVRRAKSLRDPDRLGPWLYGVAQRVALRARAQRTRRRGREQAMNPEHLAQVPVGTDPGVGPSDADSTARDRLDAALARLPRAYRDVIIVCDLEGHSHEQAAQVLSWPVGTVKGRLHRAREKLRVRLTAQGATGLTAAGVASLLAREGRAATSSSAGGASSGGLLLPASLVESTVRAATALAAGSSSLAAAGLVPSAGALGLAEGVLQGMFWKPIATAGAALLTCGAVATSGALLAASPPRQDPGEESPQTQALAQAADDADNNADANASQDPTPPDAAQKADVPKDVQAASERLARARQGLAEFPFERLLGRLGLDATETEVYVASLRVLAERIAMPDPSELPDRKVLVPALAAHSSRMKRLNAKVHQLVSPDAPPSDAGMMGGSGMMDGGSGMMMGGMGPGSRRTVLELNPVQAEFYEAQAELWSAESRAGMPPTGLLDAIGSLPPPDASDRLAPPPVAEPTPTAAVIPPPNEPPVSLPPGAGEHADPTLPMSPNELPTPNDNPPQPPGMLPPAPEPEHDAHTRDILAALDAPVSLQFPESTPIGDVLQFIGNATQTPSLAEGLPIYLDPTGLVEQRRVAEGAPSTPDSDDASLALSNLRARPVSLNLANVPLRTGLRLALKQAGLGYIVKDGLVYVGVLGSPSFEDEKDRGEHRVEGYGELQTPAQPRPAPRTF
jgi:RNA polymerase sigma factor (sigma-70 family)